MQMDEEALPPTIEAIEPASGGSVASRTGGSDGGASQAEAVPTVCTAEFMVENATGVFRECNGHYRCDGESNGKPKFGTGESVLFCNEEGKWQVQLRGVACYESCEAGDLPPLGAWPALAARKLPCRVSKAESQDM